MKKVLKQLFTGKDGETQDMGRWSWAASMFAVTGHSVWGAISHATVDILQLAQAIGVIVAAHGGALWAKRTTEPDNEEPK